MIGARPVWLEKPHPAVSALKAVVLLGCVVVMAYPLLYVLLVSFATTEGMSSNAFLPTQFSLDAYRSILGGTLVPGALLVSVVVTVVGTLASLLFTTTLAYGLTRTREVPGAKAALYLVFFTMLFSAGYIPMYLLVKNLQLLDSLASLVVPTLIAAFNLVVIRNFFMELPEELVDSAKVDGASEWRTFWSIILPLSKAPLSVIGLFYAVGYWNSFFTALLYISDTGKWPIQMILYQYVLQDQTLGGIATNPAGVPPPSESVQMAVVVVATVPILLLYPFLQRHFTKGVLTGAIKG